ncbi:MAG: YajQ family cyclic di-GMP-binding protein [Bacteroidia bacterium]|nr:YajQ family cyclic di-GMP-binding protein [Bacteroidia bacterium]
MASFDIVSKVDLQTLDNAINSAKNEIATRYDLKDSGSTVELDKKEFTIHLLTGSEMYMDSIEKVIVSKLVKQQLDPSCLDLGKQQYAAGDKIKKDVTIKQGLDRELAKKIVKMIKDTKMKVQPQIMDDMIRVNGKKLDDLQEVISLCKQAEFDMPLQYVNMK